MKIQFDWHFEDERKTPAASSRDRDKCRGSQRERGYFAEKYRPFTERAAASKATYGSVLTRNQCRVHAALARIRPWLCPYAQPEPFAGNRGRRTRLMRGISAGSRSHRKGRPDQIALTRSQRRLHAALARTRPWLCPYGRPE
jgi:hypothetical protein